MYDIAKKLPEVERFNLAPQNQKRGLKEEGHGLLHRINGYIAYLRKKKSEVKGEPN